MNAIYLSARLIHINIEHKRNDFFLFCVSVQRFRGKSHRLNRQNVYVPIFKKVKQKAFLLICENGKH